METAFTPYLSLVGGALIGLSAVLLMLTHGRIAGISGIVSRLLPPVDDRSGVSRGLVFIGGLLLAAPLYALVRGGLPASTFSAGPVSLAIAGVLVGFGAVLGNGCTSGHGVCGLSRLSMRSLVAVGVFMGTAFATTFLVRHGMGV